MTLANCLDRMKHFRDLGREGEALAWQKRAEMRGWVKPVEKKLVPLRDKK